MEANFPHCLQLVLAHEGGYVNDPRDPGGRTNRGVTQRAWEAYIGHSVDEPTMRALSVADVTPFYKTQYWDKIKGDALPSGIDCVVFDYAVNSGTSRAAKALQQAAGVLVDGAIGPATLAAVNAADHPRLIERICDLRLAFLRGLSTFAAFGKGWTCRVDGVHDEARDLTKAVA
ncbi:zliS Lysozyme family protein [uncultured Caudovirales phage]|uniref:ZliS Lysozyme family protein n=1 Tax=uncultured Caudovirales phage TaxID=2100421 RepID=A0A6J5KX56_9CAUD|nr:zliS Lysozyme family protein [uncultured Caudovirales phage]